jgi:hypothetical protein
MLEVNTKFLLNYFFFFLFLLFFFEKVTIVLLWSKVENNLFIFYFDIETMI